MTLVPPPSPLTEPAGSFGDWTAAGLFPLVPAPVRACSSLSRRVDLVEGAVREAHVSANQDAVIAAATRALTAAARIAAECGDTQLAARVTSHHTSVYADLARTLTASEAHHMLAPLIGLARLGAASLDERIATLRRMLHATRAQIPITVSGVVAPLGNIRATVQQRSALVALLHRQLLVTATTALPAVERWEAAVALARAYGGIGHDLGAGRQILVLERLYAGDRAGARSRIEESVVGQWWHAPVAACLQVLAADPDQRGTAALALLEQYRHTRDLPGPELLDVRASHEGPRPAGGHAGDGTSRDRAPDRAAGANRVGFVGRFGLVVASLTTTGPAAGIPAARHIGQQIARELVTRALEVPDGYTARDVLRHDATSRVASAEQHTQLVTIIRKAGLLSGALTDYQRRRLNTAADQAAEALRGAL